MLILISVIAWGAGPTLYPDDLKARRCGRIRNYTVSIAAVFRIVREGFE
jgi:hypothetical protein